jgi:hypothetical protein
MYVSIVIFYIRGVNFFSSTNTIAVLLLASDHRLKVSA